jgi:hypothetical protein
MTKKQMLETLPNSAEKAATTFFSPACTKRAVVRRLFGGGYVRPKKDEDGVLQCHCHIPNPAPWGDGTHYCMRCKANWYH